MNYILVATESVAGSIKITGPITGKDWLVTPQGTWIADEFERNDKQLLNLGLTRYCRRLRKQIETKIFLIEPSFQQMESMPIGG